MLTDEQLEALAAAVIGFLGIEEDQEAKDRAYHTVGLMVTLVRGYTRGRGFSDGGDHLVIAEDLQAVIITATARMVVNPAQAHGESESGPVVAMFAGTAAPVLTGGTTPVASQEGTGAIAGRAGINPVLGVQSTSFSSGVFEFTPVEKAVLHQWRIRNG